MAERADTEGDEPEGVRLFLSTLERGVAFVVAAVLVCLASVVYIWPAYRQAAVDGCTATPPSDCVVTVQDASTTILVALVALAGASFLIGLLGIRFTSIKAAGVELGAQVTEQRTQDLDEEVEKGDLQEVAPVVAEARVRTAPREVWSKLPKWVQSGLYRWASDNPILDKPLEEAVESAYKPRGRGDFAWSVKLATSEGERALRVSQGRGSIQAQ